MGLEIPDVPTVSKEEKPMKEIRETIASATAKVAAKINDASPESVQRVIRKDREGLNATLLIARLLRFDGNSIADLQQLLQTRNSSVGESVAIGRGQKSTLDDLERRGGALYSNMGSKHEFWRKL
ncbi:MAG: hypothetical protein AAB517_01665 [Patescibacteria group bacterium]